MILSADKGNATVLMTREECNNNMVEILNMGMYHILKRDPMAAHDAKIGCVVREGIEKN